MSASLPEPIVIVNKVDGLRIHTFVSAFTGSNIANATHIIESRNVLVIIDGQFLTTYATKFRQYAIGLGKPIDRLYLSHRHPDHWFGLATAFGDVRIYALQETIDFIAKNGEQSRQDHLDKMGDEAPKSIIVPGNVARPGVHTIDGVIYVLDRVIDTEIDFLLTIRIPDFGISIPQDLIYSDTHLYLTRNFSNWISILQKMLLSDDQLFLAGHGYPADKREVAKNIEYLIEGNQAWSDELNQEQFKQRLLEIFPARRCPAIFDIYLDRLFGLVQDY